MSTSTVMDLMLAILIVRMLEKEHASEAALTSAWAFVHQEAARTQTKVFRYATALHADEFPRCSNPSCTYCNLREK